MSDWRLDLQDLARAGGRASTKDWGTYYGRRDLKDYGLATSEPDPDHPGRHYIYTLTQLGRDMADGRAVRINMGPNPPVVRATWLKALPRANEVRIA